MKCALAAPNKAWAILQLKITLMGILPPVWRRIHVCSSDTFEQLQEHIQRFMGWKQSHLHEFETDENIHIVDVDYEDVFGFDFDKVVKEDKVKLSQFLKTPNDKVKYIYDFGDNWEHLVVLEKILPFKDTVCYPKCVGGRRACPPEDCGGVSGYAELLKVLANPSPSECEKKVICCLDQYYPNFDPERFEVTEF
ncbi:uncharacterized protein y4hQ-like isoform X2 [Tribolium madens]|uniref:uncharacterized protein y4hQ-like isoform X2 n=1 Tax=Tribolium madens TaxID=41895 RepID=UPI001CF73F0E|nr:uncharacterized protein y4hQ-like isoform X2 [Tribolium madens]